MLQNKKKYVNTNVYKSMKEHVNECNACWNMWNRVRWDAASRSKDFSDLKEYFGQCYIPYFDSSWALANQWYSQNPSNEDEVANFYRTTPYYIYNSFIFSRSGDKISQIKSLSKIFKEYKIKSVLDYGCGIGLDGEEFLEHGFEVHFADFESPSTNFLRWRLRKNKLKEKAFVHNIETIKEKNINVDLIWSVDVIEHMLNPNKIFDVFTEKTRLFIYYIDSADKNGGRHPFHFDVNYNKVEKKLIELGFVKVNHEIFQIWGKNN
ncbi:methyltransferase domain-containing protein [Patescibacteria group bacterium]|nr:methyltransferase domain-containing protein [Patescibacteria group bacterium]